MFNPFLEERNFALLSAPAYIWRKVDRQAYYSFGEFGDGPVPRAFLILEDGNAAIVPPDGEEQYFPVKAGMFIPGAIQEIVEENEVEMLIFF